MVVFGLWLSRVDVISLLIFLHWLLEDISLLRSYWILEEVRWSSFVLALELLYRLLDSWLCCLISNSGRVFSRYYWMLK